MQSVPEAVARTFARLKENSNSAIVLRVVDGRYYVYSTQSRWDKENKKVVSRQQYLGLITGRGMFIRKAEPWTSGALKQALKIVQAHGGQVLFPENPEETAETGRARREELSDADKQVLTILSMNARAPMAFIMKNTGLTRSETATRISKLEKRYDIKYILEINASKLGIFPYIMLVKFADRQPPTALLKKLLSDEPRIQFAAMTKGAYDLVIYWLDTDDPLISTAAGWKLETNPLFAEYPGRWDVLFAGQTYSFVPMRSVYLDKVLKEMVVHGHRRRGDTASTRGVLRQKEFLLIKELNDNSVKKFADVDESCKFSAGTARYTYKGMLQNGLLVRPTITMQKAPMGYLGMILGETVNAIEEEATLDKLLSWEIEYGPVLNKCVLTENLGLSSSAMFFVPVTEEGGLEHELAYLRENTRGWDFKGLVVSEVLVGHLCYRRFDNTHSSQYQRLVSMGKMQPKEKIHYG